MKNLVKNENDLLTPYSEALWGGGGGDKQRTMAAKITERRGTGKLYGDIFKML